VLPREHSHAMSQRSALALQEAIALLENQEGMNQSYLIREG